MVTPNLVIGLLKVLLGINDRNTIFLMWIFDIFQSSLVTIKKIGGDSPTHPPKTLEPGCEQYDLVFMCRK